MSNRIVEMREREAQAWADYLATPKSPELIAACNEIDAAVWPKLYSVGTWDTELQAYTPQIGVPAFNLTLYQLRQSLRMLRDRGYSCHRFRDADGSHDDNDTSVIVERTDGKRQSAILKGWKRPV